MMLMLQYRKRKGSPKFLARNLIRDEPKVSIEIYIIYLTI